jgi:hypothetical protein
LSHSFDPSRDRLYLPRSGNEKGPKGKHGCREQLSRHSPDPPWFLAQDRAFEQAGQLQLIPALRGAQHEVT